MCERLLANPLIEDYEIARSSREVRRRPLPRLVRRGRRAAGRPPRRRGRAALARRPRPHGVDAVIVPGGFSYGDYLRAGAIARFSPVMEAVERFARRGRPGARHLQRLPGAVRGRPAARRAAAEHLAALRLPPGRRSRSSTRHAVHARHARAGDAALDPGQAHDRPLLRARPRCSTSSRRTARSSCATRRGHNPNGSARDIAGVTNAARQRARPDAAPRARGRPAHGLGRRPELFESVAGASAVPARRHPRRGTASSGLTDAEYDLIVEKLGREPNEVELAMFSLMWSEHCGYKHSRSCCGRCPPRAARLLMGPGENAGAVDVGDGLAVAFKVESHNHPSAVEPFQGAATGVGGILRDVFAIGARPIAVLDSLRFGELGARERSRYLLEQRRRRHRPLRQLDRRRRPSAARSTSRSPTSRTAWSTRCASGSIERDKLIRQRGGGRRQRRRAVRRADRPRRHRRRLRARLAPSSARATRPSARRSRSATRSRRRSCSSAASSCSTAGCSSRCRTSARPA